METTKCYVVLKGMTEAVLMQAKLKEDLPIRSWHKNGDVHLLVLDCENEWDRDSDSSRFDGLDFGAVLDLVCAAGHDMDIQYLMGEWDGFGFAVWDPHGDGVDAGGNGHHLFQRFNFKSERVTTFDTNSEEPSSR